MLLLVLEDRSDNGSFSPQEPLLNCHDFSKIIESGLPMISTSSLREGVKYLGLFQVFCHQVLYPVQQHIFSSLPFADDVPVDTAFLSCCPSTSLIRFNPRCTWAFLTPSLHTQTVSLYSSWVTCPCFHLLCASFLCLSFAKISLPPFAGYPAHCNGLFFTMEKIIPENQPALLRPRFSLG